MTTEKHDRCGGKPGEPNWQRWSNDDQRNEWREKRHLSPTDIPHNASVCGGCHDCQPDNWCACGLTICIIPALSMDEKYHANFSPRTTDACNVSMSEHSDAEMMDFLLEYAMLHPSAGLHVALNDARESLDRDKRRAAEFLAANRKADLAKAGAWYVREFGTAVMLAWERAGRPE